MYGKYYFHTTLNVMAPLFTTSPPYRCFSASDDARIRFEVTADTLNAFMKRLHAQCERLDLTPSHRWFVFILCMRHIQKLPMELPRITEA